MAACEIKSDDSVADCQLITEAPEHLGFGEALLKLAPKYRYMSLRNGECNRYFHLALIRWQWGRPKHDPDAAHWIKKPSPADLASAYPQPAKDQKIPGIVFLRCTSAVDATLKACRVSYESPAGQGFGAAALSLVPQFNIAPEVRDGHAVEVDVNIPVGFLPTGIPFYNCYSSG